MPSSPQSPRLGYLVSHPIQYQAPLFRRLAQSPHIRFRALFGCGFGLDENHDPDFGQKVDFGVDLLGGFEHHFICRPRHPRVDKFWALRLPFARRVSALEDCDAVILHGWRTAMLWQAAAKFCTAGKPYFIRAETPLLGKQQSRPPLKRMVWQALVGRLVRGAAGVLAVGSANERFYRMLRVPAEKIHRVPYFVDNTAVTKAAAVGRQRRNELRARHQIPANSFLLVAVGKLIPRKRPLDLLRCLSGLPADVHLLWIGTGGLQSEVERAIARGNLQKRVHLVGFKPSHETWELMGASDCFVHPAEAETWGLVVNEALAAGLPLLVSAETGSAEDLVIEGVTGTILPVGDIGSWQRAVMHRHGRTERGYRSRPPADELLNEFSIENAVTSIDKMIAQQVRQPDTITA